MILYNGKTITIESCNWIELARFMRHMLDYATEIRSGRTLGHYVPKEPRKDPSIIIVRLTMNMGYDIHPTLPEIKLATCSVPSASRFQKASVFPYLKTPYLHFTVYIIVCYHLSLHGYIRWISAKTTCMAWYPVCKPKELIYQHFPFIRMEQKIADI